MHSRLVILVTSVASNECKKIPNSSKRTMMKLLETTLSGGSDYASNDAAGAPITVTVKPNQPHVISSGKLLGQEM
jgi:hypothetical protein